MQAVPVDRSILVAVPVAKQQLLQLQQLGPLARQGSELKPQLLDLLLLGL